jgi:hypothetical protein
MTDMAFPIPVSVPKAINTDGNGTGNGAGTTDIQAGVVQDSSKLDQNKDARKTEGTETSTPAASTDPMPTNHDADLKKARERAAKKAKKTKKSPEAETQNTAAPAPAAQTQSNTTPADAQQPTQAQPTQVQPAAGPQNQ